MAQHAVYTCCTALPPSVTRATVMATFRDYESMTDLNPTIIAKHICQPPPKAAPEEQGWVWYVLTEAITYFPGFPGRVTFHAAFHDLPDGLQTHCYAPLGVDIRERWSVGGNEAGEPSQAPPLGIGAPESGLYIREDIDMRCNFLTTSIVKRGLKNNHTKLFAKLVEMASTVVNGKIDDERLAAVEDPPTKSPNSYGTGSKLAELENGAAIEPVGLDSGSVSQPTERK